MNFEEDAQEQASSGELSTIAHLVDKYETAQQEIERLEQELKAAKQQRDKIGCEDIPAAMDQVGLSEVKLTDGRPVHIKQVTRASIPKAKQDEAFKWLEENGYGDLIKGELKTMAGRGEYERLAQIANMLERDYGYSNTVKQTVHPGTLSAFVREKREQGEPLPDDLLGVYEYRETKVG